MIVINTVLFLENIFVKISVSATLMQFAQNNWLVNIGFEKCVSVHHY